MTTRLSTALSNYLNSEGSLRQALQGGVMKIYSGAQPASADAAPTGTLLCTISASSAAHTSEVRATGTVTLAGSSGSVTALTVDGKSIIDAAVPFNTSLTQTAADLAAAINSSENGYGYTATSAAAVVTIIAPRGLGAAANSLAVVSTVSTLTKTDVNLSGGVTQVNGLKYGASSGKVLSKSAAQTWSGVNVADGTAGWYRFEGAVADSGVADATASQIRIDGAISTSGAQLNLSSTTIASGATTTIASFTHTLPSA